MLTVNLELTFQSSPKEQALGLKKKHIAVIPGDGIGQEVIPQAVNVMQASGADVALTDFDWGADRYLRDQVTVPPDGFAMLARDFDAILVGAFGDPRVKTNIHAKEILLGMRFKMDLYANVRPVRLLDAALCPLKGVEPKDVDFVVLRENTDPSFGLHLAIGKSLRRSISFPLMILLLIGSLSRITGGMGCC